MKKTLLLVGVLLFMFFAGAYAGIGDGSGFATIAPDVAATTTTVGVTITVRAGSTAWVDGKLYVTIPTYWTAPTLTGGYAAGEVSATATGSDDLTLAVNGQAVTITGINCDANTSSITVHYWKAVARNYPVKSTFIIYTDPLGDGGQLSSTNLKPFITVAWATPTVTRTTVVTATVTKTPYIHATTEPTGTPVLQITKTSSTQHVTKDTNFTYTLKVSKSSGDNIASVNIWDTLPVDLTPVSCNPAAAATTEPAIAGTPRIMYRWAATTVGPTPQTFTLVGHYDKNVNGNISNRAMAKGAAGNYAESTAVINMNTQTVTKTVTKTITPTFTITFTPTFSRTITETSVMTSTFTKTITETHTFSPTFTVTPVCSATFTYTVTPQQTSIPATGSSVVIGRFTEAKDKGLSYCFTDTVATAGLDTTKQYEMYTGLFSSYSFKINPGYTGQVTIHIYELSAADYSAGGTTITARNTNRNTNYSALVPTTKTYEDGEYNTDTAVATEIFSQTIGGGANPEIYCPFYMAGSSHYIISIETKETDNEGSLYVEFFGN
jgi:hypothetical protein